MANGEEIIELGEDLKPKKATAPAVAEEVIELDDNLMPLKKKEVTVQGSLVQPTPSGPQPTVSQPTVVASSFTSPSDFSILKSVSVPKKIQKTQVDFLKDRVKERMLNDETFFDILPTGKMNPNGAKNREQYLSKLTSDPAAAAEIRQYGENIAGNRQEFQGLIDTVNKNPNDRNSLYNLAQKHLDFGEPEQAIQVYTKAMLAPKSTAMSVQGAPDIQEASDSNILYDIGAAYEKMGQKDNAIDFYKDAVKADKNNAIALHALGKTAYSSGDMDVAKVLFDASKKAEFEQSLTKPPPPLDQALSPKERYYEALRNPTKEGAYILGIADMLEGVATGSNPLALAFNPPAVVYNALKEGSIDAVETFKRIPEAYEKEGAVGAVATGAAGFAKMTFAALNGIQPELALFTYGTTGVGQVLPEQYMNWILAPVSELLKYTDLKDSETGKAVAMVGDLFFQALAAKGLKKGGEAYKIISDKIKNKEPLTKEEFDTATSAVAEIPIEELVKTAKDISPVVEKAEVIKGDEAHTQLKTKESELVKGIETAKTETVKNALQKDLEAVREEISKKEESIAQKAESENAQRVFEENIDSQIKDLEGEKQSAPNETVKAAIEKEIDLLTKTKENAKSKKVGESQVQEKVGEQAGKKGSDEGVLLTPETGEAAAKAAAPVEALPLKGEERSVVKKVIAEDINSDAAKEAISNMTSEQYANLTLGREDGSFVFKEDAQKGGSEVRKAEELIHQDRVKESIKNGEYKQWIDEGKISPEKAKEIIESANLEVPKEINDLITVKPIEDATRQIQEREILREESQGADTQRQAAETSISDSLLGEEGRQKAQEVKLAEIRLKRQKAVDDLVSHIRGEKQGIVPDSTAGLDAIKRIAESYIEEGYLRAEDIIRKIREDFKGTIDEDFLTKNKKVIEDAIEGSALKERGLITSLKEDVATPEYSQANLKGAYKEITNKQTSEEASAKLKEVGEVEAERIIRESDPSVENRVRSEMARQLFEKNNESGAALEREGKTEEANKFYDKANEIAENEAKNATKVAQGLQVYSLWSKSTPAGLLRFAENFIKKYNTDHKTDIKLSDEARAKIKEMASEMRKLPEGFKRDRATAEIMEYITKQAPISWTDMYWGLRYSSMLSGVSTQIANAGGSISSIVGELLSQAIRNPKELPYALAGLYKGFGNGFILAKDALMNKNARGKMGAPNVLEMMDFKGGKFNPFNYFKYVFRFMSATDDFFSSGLKEMESRGIAREVAKREGLKGKDIGKRVVEILNDYTEVRNNAIEQAKSEGFKGNELKRRVIEIIEKSRPEDLVDQAETFSKYGTFNYEPKGVMGALSKTSDLLAEKVPPYRVIVPFTRIIANVVNSSLDYTPYGYKRLFMGHYGGEGKFKSGSREFYQQMSRANLGTLAMTTLATFFMKDEGDDASFDITGGGTGDYKKDLQLEKTRPKYSVKINGKWFSYKNWSNFYIPFLIMGNIKDAKKYKNFSEEDLSTRAGMIGGMGTRAIMDMSFLQGVSTFMDAIKDPDKQSKFFDRLVSSEATILFPNFARQMMRVFDDKMYEASDVKTMMLRNLGLTGGLKPKLNILGEEVERTDSMIPLKPKEVSDDPVWKMLRDKKIFISSPSKQAKIGERFITDDEYYDLIKISGRAAKERLAKDIAKIDKMLPKDAEKYVDDIIRQERERAKTALTMKSGEDFTIAKKRKQGRPKRQGRPQR